MLRLLACVVDLLAHTTTNLDVFLQIVRQLSEELGRDLSGEKNAIKEFIKAGQ